MVSCWVFMAKLFLITDFLYHHCPQQVHVCFCLTVSRIHQLATSNLHSAICQLILIQYSTQLKGTFVPNEDYFFKQKLFQIISYLIFILLNFTWVCSSWDNPIAGSCHGQRVSSCHGELWNYDLPRMHSKSAMLSSAINKSQIWIHYTWF
jgi:hypothetical protein